MDEDVIDQTAIAVLLESVGGDLDFLEDLLGDYLEDSPIQLSEMQQALESGEAERLRRAAHTLKSNSANFGAVKLAESCRELERIGATTTLGAASESLARAVIEYQEVKRVLKDVVNGYRS